MPKFHRFDNLRLFFALSVIFSHSFLIADGNESAEPFVRMLGAGNIIGIYGVFGFLILSGFLVCWSMDRTGSILPFLAKRTLRIYPALIVCALLTVLLVAPLFAVNGALSWLFGGEAFYVFAKSLVLPVGMGSEQVAFYETSSVQYSNLPHSLNGSLWTILVEIQFYLAVALLYKLGLFGLRPAIQVLIASVALLVMWDFTPAADLVSMGRFEMVVSNLIFAGPALASGMVTYFIWKKRGTRDIHAFIAVALLVPATVSGIGLYAFPVLAAYPIVHLCTAKSSHGVAWWRRLDLTYGTYLYGWPVTQVLRAWLGPETNGWTLFALAAPLSLLCGWLSWHFVERHFKLGWLLRLRERRIRAQGSPTGPASAGTAEA